MTYFAGTALRWLAWVFPAALAGCAPTSRLTLIQPDAPAAQQRMELASDWARTTVEQGRRWALLDFPRPGSKDGPADFRAFVALPAANGAWTFAGDRGADLQHAAQGFLIQVVGRRRGKTEFAGGSVRTWTLPLARRLRIELDARCADGTTLRGRAVLRDDDGTLRRFLRDYAGDVAALGAPTTQPAAETDADSPEASALPATPARAETRP